MSDNVVDFPARGSFPDRAWALEKADMLLKAIQYAALQVRDPEALRPAACYASKLVAYIHGTACEWTMDDAEALLRPPPGTR